MDANDLIPLLEITRGGIVESIHFGAIAVVDTDGRLLFAAGNPQSTNFLRSSAKPFQTLPLVEMGGVEFFHFTEQELALTCASHSGTDAHVAVIESMQAKIGIQESALECGTHPPLDEPTQEELIRNHLMPTPNRHNCSGKHTGMLAQAKMRSLPLEGYIDPAHPVQQTILSAFSQVANIEPEKIIVGTDGCSVPTFAVPLYNAAFAFARLCQPEGLEKNRSQSLERIVHAMMHYPQMVAGPGRFDTELMEASPDKIICKGGAEGFQALGLMPGTLGKNSPGIGIAFKVSDGDLGGHIRPTHPGVSPDSRARPLITLAILKQMGMPEDTFKQLTAFDARPVRNWQKREVGSLTPVFSLKPQEAAHW